MKLLKALRVYDIAHVAWRMRVCGDLENAIEKFNKVWSPCAVMFVALEFSRSYKRGGSPLAGHTCR
jgi:hypothetical protein